MRKDRLKRFQKMFESEKKNVIFNDRILRDDFSINSDDRYDEVDQATTDTEQAMRMRLCNREVLYLKKLDEALRRIEDGTFGLCVECEEEIELKRLEARPTATHCVFCKEEQERREGSTLAGRESKSMGEGFTRRFG